MARRFAFLLTAVTLMVVMTGCTTIAIPRDGGGRSRMQQVLLTESIDDSVAMMDFRADVVAGRRVFIKIGDVDYEGVVSDYINSSIAVRLVDQGAIIAQSIEESDVILIVKVKAAGVDSNDSPLTIVTVLRDIFYRSNTMRAAAHLQASAVSTQSPGPLYERYPEGFSKHSYREMILLFGLLGPFTSHSTKSVEF
jgi:hypothetical protein